MDLKELAGDPARAVTKLIDCGWTQMRLAAYASTSQSTISQIKNGTEPSYALGTAMVRLAARAKPRRK